MRNPKENKRLLSLDVLRGITVAGMILVNNSAGEPYAPLKHSEWNGMTPCDLVFPFFLYIMGISTYLSLRKFQFKCSKMVVQKIVRRTILIFFIGLCLNWLGNGFEGDWQLSYLRIMGVLQRIALCYFAVSLLVLFVNHKYTLYYAFCLLAIYTVILLLGNGYATDESNIALHIDRAVWGYKHVYTHLSVDPEGLLGTISAIAHTLIGFWCGRIICMKTTTREKIMSLLLSGAIFVFAAYLLSFGLPLNKTIWSPSLVLMTCGLASLLLVVLMYVIDIQHKSRWMIPFIVFGVNPLFLYVLSEVSAIVFWQTGIYGTLFDGIHAIVTNSCFASLFFALIIVTAYGFVGLLLYKQKVFIKI